MILDFGCNFLHLSHNKFNYDAKYVSNTVWIMHSFQTIIRPRVLGRQSVRIDLDHKIIQHSNCSAYIQTRMMRTKVDIHFCGSLQLSYLILLSYNESIKASNIRAAAVTIRKVT